MKIHSFLTQGPSAIAALSTQLSEVSKSISSPIDALALFHLGVSKNQVVSAIRSSGIKSPQHIYLADSYGIIGFDESVGRNVELLEKGRGQEYGYRGGSGGEGVVAVIFSEGAVSGHDDLLFPHDIASMMIIDDTNNDFTTRAAQAPVRIFSWRIFPLSSSSFFSLN